MKHILYIIQCGENHFLSIDGRRCKTISNANTLLNRVKKFNSYEDALNFIGDPDLHTKAYIPPATLNDTGDEWHPSVWRVKPITIEVTL